MTLPPIFFVVLAVIVAAVFSARAEDAPPPATDSVVVDAPTEAVIQGALRYLADQQAGNGSWTTQGKKGEHPIAMTGYVLICFLASGNLPEEGDYAKQVNEGMKFLLDSLLPDGTFRGVDGGKYMYNHGIATLALAEIYGQTKSPAMRTKLQRAVQLIVTTQCSKLPNSGGWRYRPRPDDADISVTVMQVVALRAAKNAGIDVPQRTIDEAIEYVKRCSVVNEGGQWWTYGSNYAAPAQYMIGGETWKRWYAAMHDKLLKTVKKNGDQSYWEGEVGAVYCTAVHATILAMPYHYIPLYQR